MTEATIADHGLIGDLHICALVSTDTTVLWSSYAGGGMYRGRQDAAAP